MKTLKNNWTLARHKWWQSLSFGLLWGFFLAAHSFVSLYLLGWQNFNSIGKFSLLVLAGPIMGGAAGWFAAPLLGAPRIAQKRLATAMVLILLFTIGTTALLFALQYRIYYAQWHMATLSIGWIFQFVFTTASAMYLFAVQGLRTMLPLGPLALLVAAWIFMKSVRAETVHGK